MNMRKLGIIIGLMIGIAGVFLMGASSAHAGITVDSTDTVHADRRGRCVTIRGSRRCYWVHIHREQLVSIERSLQECARHTVEYGKTLPPDSRERRDIDTDIARATEMLAEIRNMLNSWRK